MIVESQFRATWWLRNRHAQTIWQSLFRKQAKIALQRERFELPDGDFLDIDKTQDYGNDIVIILHGLEGRLDAKYSGMLKTLSDHQYSAILMYHRSCSGEINRQAKSYHSGFTDDIHFLMQKMKARYPARKINVVAYSLGASITLNYLANFPQDVLPDFAYAISTPFALQNGAQQLNNGFSKIYRQHLLKRMIRKIKEKQHLADIQALDTEKLINCNDFTVFDHEYTAKVSGFKSGIDYYTQCSCTQYLHRIKTKTHILHAADDPFMTQDAIPKEKELSNSITLELSQKGGHVGFISGFIPFKLEYWAETRLLELLKQ